MKTVFDTAMTAHVWAQGRQEEGRNQRSSVFFEGPCLYSYGRHFLTGYRLPDGAAFLNSDSYSVSTSRHQRDARHAIRGRGLYLPGNTLKAVAAFLESSVYSVSFWTWPDGFTADSPYGHDGRLRSEARPGKRAASPADLKAARPALLKLFLSAKESSPAESIVAAFRYAGAKPEDAAAAARKVTLAHAKRAELAKAEEAARAKAGAESDARAAAARPLSDFAGAVEKARRAIKESNWRGKSEEEAARLLDAAKRLWKAGKAAKARGWTRVAADLKAREKLLRAGAAGLESYSMQCARVAYWGERKAAIRAGLAALSGQGPAIVGGYDWQKKREAAESILKSIRAAALVSPEEESDSFSVALARVARKAGADLPRMAAGLESIVAALQGAESRAYAGQARATRRGQVAALRAFLKAPESASHKVAEEAAKVAGQFALVQYDAGPAAAALPGAYRIPDYRPTIPGPFALAGFTGESFRDIQKAARARADLAKMEEAAAALDAWRDGAGALPHYRMSDAAGGALIRARGVQRDESGAITGGTLESSWGASVPLAHALRAFRFLKLCRDSGKAWAANGKTLPVGHFRIESISAAGDFKAGCHRINWGEVAALAARLGVADMAPADTTESRAHA